MENIRRAESLNGNPLFMKVCMHTCITYIDYIHTLHFAYSSIDYSIYFVHIYLYSSLDVPLYSSIYVPVYSSKDVPVYLYGRHKWVSGSEQGGMENL